MINIEKNKQFVNQIWDNSIVPALVDYIRIPNKSPLFDPQWKANGHMDKAVKLISDWCLANGMPVDRGQGMSNLKSLHLVGYASGLAAASANCEAAPKVLKQSPYLADLANQGIALQWEGIVAPSGEPLSKSEKITQICLNLAEKVNALAKKNEFFTVFGGDHSCAIGTWSGAANACKEKGAMGLIWIDAHMDCHTPETSHTGNVHGMPLASLLGLGFPHLTHLLHPAPKLNPQNLCLIGIRSYESEEVALLERLKVRVFYMDEVKKKGIKAVLQEAVAIVMRGTVQFGVTIDIDAIDPKDAPGTGLWEEGGIPAKDLCQALKVLAHNPHLMGLEIAEFDPTRDIDHLTEKLIPQLILAVLKG